MSLVPLSDPVQYVGAVPMGMNLRQNAELLYTPVWSAGQQYYINDVAISALTGGAFVFSGSEGGANQYFTRGGLDPALASADSATTGWRALQGKGLRFTQTTTASITGIPAGGGDGTVPPALSLASTTSVVGLSTWNVMVQYTAVSGGAWAAADTFSFTLTPDVGVPVVVNVWPGTANPNLTTHNTVSAVVVCGADATSITLTMTKAAGGGSSLTLANTTVSYQRVA